MTPNQRPSAYSPTGSILTPTPNPNQPILNAIKEISCKIDELYQDPPTPSTTVNTIREKSTQLVSTKVGVKSTVTTLKPSNEYRLSIVIQNRGLDNLFIGMDTNVNISDCICIAKGESWSSDQYIGPIFGISDGGELDVRIQEEVK